MSTPMTPDQAWEDFYKWIRQQPEWSNIQGKERQRIYEANAAFKGQRKHPLGYSRIKDILSRYARDRYEFREQIILKQ